jgi:hypothetical protein
VYSTEGRCIPNTSTPQEKVNHNGTANGNGGNKGELQPRKSPSSSTYSQPGKENAVMGEKEKKQEFIIAHDASLTQENRETIPQVVPKVEL